jgi:nucleoside-triphosphatase THEP1
MKKDGFSIDEIGDMIFQTKRELNQNLLQKVAHDVQQLVYGLSAKSTA